MKLSALKQHLATLTDLSIIMEDGTQVAPHYHITEVGQINKHFIDCGGVVRKESVISLQLWHDNDLDHRLTPEKTGKIISLAESKLDLIDGEIEVEYQAETIGKFGLEVKGDNLVLTNKMTACLAEDQCGIPAVKKKIDLGELVQSGGACTPGGGCC